MKLFNANIRQLNIGDVQGVLDNTFNCDLTFNKGKMSISPRTRITTDNPTDFGTPIGCVYFDGYWWTVAGSYVWKSTNPQGAFVKDASNSGPYTTPNDCSSAISDITIFNGKLIVSTLSRIYRKTANGAGTGGWDLIDNGLASAIVRPVCVYNGRLYWTRLNNTIVSCDTAYTIATLLTDYTLTLPDNQVTTFIKPHSAGLYIGVTKNDGTEGLVTNWGGKKYDGTIADYNVYAQGALAAYVDNTYFYVVNSHAQLLRFNGGGFIEAARLPVKRNDLYNSNATGSSGNDRFIHPNGLTKINGNVCMLINARNNDANATQQDNIHSGIWEYLEESGTLYHKYSMSYNTIGGTTYDYGQIRIKSVGGLTNTPDLSSYSDAQKGNFLAGASFYTDASTVSYGMFTDNYFDNEKKSGFFTTVQIRAEHFEDMYNKLSLLYTPTSDIRYVIKYRKTKTPITDFDITWVTTTTFTTAQSGIVEGDEITIIQGKGGGHVAHVVGTPTFSSPNYTVTLDTAMANVTGTAKARVQKWKKIDTITNVNNFFQNSTINNPSTLIELKVVMVGTGEATIDEIVLDKKLNK